MSDVQFPHRAQYPPALHTFKRGFTLAAGIALLTALATGMLAQGAYLILALAALVHGVDWFLGRSLGPKARRAIRTWAQERYDTEVSAAEARTLSTPAKAAAGRLGDWCSEPVNVLYQNESGQSAYTELRLVRGEGRWFLYSPDYGTEVPYVPAIGEEVEQDLSVALSPLMGEVTETGGMFFLNVGDAEALTRVMTVVDEDSGQRVLLLWSDLLRAELWRASTAAEASGDLHPLHITGEGLVQGLLPQLEGEGTLVGLNWGADGHATFPAATVRTFLERYFPAA